MIEVDVSGAGAVAEPTVLDAFTTTGRGPAPVCPAEVGEVLLDPLLATDEAGADTVVYSVLSLATFEVRVQARHRAHGGPWPDRAQAAEAVTGDIVAEKLLGGPGAPLVVARSAGGKLISARAADGVWTPPAVLVGLEGAGLLRCRADRRGNDGLRLGRGRRAGTDRRPRAERRRNARRARPALR